MKSRYIRRMRNGKFVVVEGCVALRPYYRSVLGAREHLLALQSAELALEESHPESEEFAEQQLMFLQEQAAELRFENEREYERGARR